MERPTMEGQVIGPSSGSPFQGLEIDFVFEHRAVPWAIFWRAFSPFDEGRMRVTLKNGEWLRFAPAHYTF